MRRCGGAERATDELALYSKAGIVISGIAKFLADVRTFRLAHAESVLLQESLGVAERM